MDIIEAKYAEAQGDVHALRAFRLVVAPILDAVPAHQTEDRVRARALLAAFDKDFEAENPGVIELGREVQHLEGLRGIIRSEILRLETTVTGEAPQIFRPITSWMAEILGEKPEHFGGGVGRVGEPSPALGHVTSTVGE